MLHLSRCRKAAPQLRAFIRQTSSLSSNPHIKVFPHPDIPHHHLLSLLDTDPPNPSLAIGTAPSLPPSPGSFRENPRFAALLYEVAKQHAAADPDVRRDALAFASPGGSIFSQQRNDRNVEAGTGGASAQGGAGGAGVGGWVHVSDSRNPPSYGRISWPEDILGSVEVDGHGNVIGNFQESFTYRIVTNEGVLGLSDYLRERLIARLREEERKATRPTP